MGRFQEIRPRFEPEVRFLVSDVVGLKGGGLKWE